MTGSSLRSLLAQHGKIGIDSCILIYLVEDHPRYGGACASLFERIESGETAAVTSTVSLLEVLVQPYRLPDDRLAQQFYALMSTHPGLEWVSVSLEVADRAARLRARYRLKTPDAIQVATAISSAANVFLGNDRALRKVTELECVVLEDLI